MTMTDMIMTATTAAMPTATMGHGDHGGHGGHGGGDCKISVSIASPRSISISTN